MLNDIDNMDFDIPFKAFLMDPPTISWADDMDYNDGILKKKTCAIIKTKQIMHIILFKPLLFTYTKKRTCAIIKIRNKISVCKLKPFYYFKYNVTKLCFFISKLEMMYYKYKITKICYDHSIFKKTFNKCDIKKPRKKNKKCKITKICYDNQIAHVSQFYVKKINVNVSSHRIKYIAYMAGADVGDVSDIKLSVKERRIHIIANSAITCPLCDKLHKVCHVHKEPMKQVVKFYKENNLINDIGSLYQKV